MNNTAETKYFCLLIYLKLSNIHHYMGETKFYRRFMERAEETISELYPEEKPPLVRYM